MKCDVLKVEQNDKSAKINEVLFLKTNRVSEQFCSTKKKKLENLQKTRKKNEFLIVRSVNNLLKFDVAY